MVAKKQDHGVVLITGASSGIGRELALAFADRAATLVLVARRVERLETLQAEVLARHPSVKVVVLAADLADEQDIERLLGRVAEQAGPVDVLVNNAGLGDNVLFDRCDWTRTRRLLQTNVIAVTRLTAALLPGMVARGRGGVLNIGSGAGHTVLPSAAAYSGSKHFVAGFTEGLRADVAGTGVTVTQVCPGPVDSEFDQVAGSVGGMPGAPPEFIRIGARQCAVEAVAGFERGDAVVFPGWAYRTLIRMLPLAPRGLLRRQAAGVAAKLRASAGKVKN